MAKYIHATINFYDITGYSRRRLRSQEKMHVDEFNTALAVLPNLLIHDNTQEYHAYQTYSKSQTIASSSAKQVEDICPSHDPRDQEATEQHRLGPRAVTPASCRLSCFLHSVLATLSAHRDVACRHPS